MELTAKLRVAIENEDFAAIEAIEGDTETKLQGYAYIMRELDARYDSMRDLANDYAEKGTVAKDRKDKLRNYATACMRGAFGIKAGEPIPEDVKAKFEGVATIWLQSNPEKLDGTLDSLLEEEKKLQDEHGPGYIYPFIIREAKPATDAIKAAVLRGEQVGDYQITRDNHLRYN